MTLGENIIKYREKAGLTQKELAQKIGVSNQRLSNWEKNINKPSPDRIYDLCIALNVPADDLLGLKKTFELSINQIKLLNIYKKLKRKSQEIVMGIAEDLLELQNTLIEEKLDAEVSKKKPTIQEILDWDEPELLAAHGSEGMTEEELEELNEDAQRAKEMLRKMKENNND